MISIKSVALFLTFCFFSLVLTAQNSNPWPVTGPVGIGVNTSITDPLTVSGNIRIIALTTNKGLFAMDQSTGGNAIFSLTRQTNDLSINSFDGIGFTTAARSGPSTAYSMFINTSGNLGLGTIAPVAKLNILKNSAQSDPSITSTAVDNLVVLQTAYSANPLNYNATGYKWGIQFWGHNDSGTLDQSKTGTIYAVSEDGSMGFNRAVGLAFHTSSFDAVSAERLRITSTGNLLIGKTSQTNTAYRVDVAGGIRANQIVVNTTGADFVFKPTYNLVPLSTIKSYIDKNHHLPEIPSASEMQVNGLNVGDNQIKLLQKIEELTLYLIEKDKKNSQIARKLMTVTKELKQLKKELIR